MKRVFTSGSFDLFHVGHLNILEKSAALGDELIVGVSTDELVLSEKHKAPVIPFTDRARIVGAIRCVDRVVPQTDKNKIEAWRKYGFKKMFVGSDWKGTDAWNAYERQFAEVGVEIIYFPHTDRISSTLLRESFGEKADED